MGDVIELFGSRVRSVGWTEQEKAELYRAASLLGARGLPFDTESGVSDDGDPWFLFVGRGTGEVLVHFARIDGTFVVHHAAADVIFKADDIRDLVDRVLLSPDRVAGRATGDAVYSHIATTVAALALSTASLVQFDQEMAAAPSLPEDQAEPPVAAPGDTVGWVLGDDAETDADSLAGSDGDTVGSLGDLDGADTPDAGPDVSSVEIPEEQPTPLGGIVDDSATVEAPPVVAEAVVDPPEMPTVAGAPVIDGVVVTGGSADDTLVGTDRNDFLAGGAGNDLILAGKGDDIVSGGDGADTVDGGAGDDILLGGAGNDLLYGGRGDDLMLGGAGDDLLHGGKGNDTLEGQMGRDTLSGDEGDDLLIASDGDAVMFGGAGTNVFHFAPGEATAYAGPGRDIFVYEEGERTDAVIHDFDPDQDVLLYLDRSGKVVDFVIPAPDDHGEADIAPSLGGSLRILFADLDGPIT
ncbi:MAG: calcium-binding protein [Alphaproteobacteria bacterium]